MKMHAYTSSEELDSDLLQQFESILDHDKLIDEIGFLHPTQLAELNEDSDIDTINVGNKSNTVQYNRKAFWIKNHKLAISIHVLTQLYNGAFHAYRNLITGYKQPTVPPLEKDSFENANREAEILMHTRALLILSYDFKTIWNSRKLILSRKQDTLLLFQDEFQLSTLILSYAPKSESAWSHRRWLIKIIAEKGHDLYEIIEKESELVKSIAEKSKMNYRAWNHRCWLVSYMTKSQVVDELNKSRKWAELHAADNCCFHYRRRLMLRILDDSVVEGNKGTSDIYGSTVCIIWKEELQWNKLLLQCYIGREALWIHRRFLSQCWLKNLAPVNDLDNFVREEIELLKACIDVMDDEFSDGCSQARHAVSYILWVSKQIHSDEEVKLHRQLEVVGGLEALLEKNCPERRLLWKKLLG